MYLFSLKLSRQFPNCQFTENHVHLLKNTRGEGISPGLEEPIYRVFQGLVLKWLSHGPEMTLIKISSRE